MDEFEPQTEQDRWDAAAVDGRCPRCLKEPAGPYGGFGAACHYSIQRRSRVIALDRIKETNSLSLGDAAAAYAIAGVPVHPIAPLSKLPATTNGVLDASTDLSTVRAWWSLNPRFNIGLATGHVFDALDVDTKDGKPGEQSLETIQRLGFLSGGWASQATPSGGKHVLFAAGGDGNHASARTGLDFRGRGGYILGAPSTLSGGGMYHWEFTQGGRCGATFDWYGALAHLLPEDARPRTPEYHGRGDGKDLDGLVRFVLAAQEGERNHSLFWAASRAHEKGLDHSPLLEAALKIGLSHGEATRTIQSAQRARRSR